MSCAFCRDGSLGFEDAAHRVQKCLSGRGIDDAQALNTKPTPRSESSRTTLPSSGRLRPSPPKPEHRSVWTLPLPTARITASKSEIAWTSSQPRLAAYEARALLSAPRAQTITMPLTLGQLLERGNQSEMIRTSSLDFIGFLRACGSLDFVRPKPHHRLRGFGKPEGLEDR